MIEITMQHLNFCAHYSADTKADLEEIINEVGNIQKPEALPNESKSIDPSEMDEFEIIYSDGPPEPPSDIEDTVFVLNTKDEETLHTHLYAPIESLELLLSLQKEVLEAIPLMNVVNLNIYFDLDTTMDKLPITTDGDFSLLGATVKYRENEYIFFDDDGKAGVRFDYEQEGEVNQSTVTDFVEEVIELAEDDLSNLLKDSQ